jgi:hypothetical protein
VKLQNSRTGDVLELPPPDAIGSSVVILNGAVVEHALYSDEDGSVTLGSGRKFLCTDDWVAYILERLASGAWSPEVER